MKRFDVLKVPLLIAAVMLFLAPIADAQPQPPQTDQVDHGEIARWGDRVVVAGEGHRDGGEMLYSAAVATPADDSDQWFITIWGSSRDAATAQLVKAFERDPHLAAFVAPPPGEGKRPWAHFNVYFADNSTQRWRFARHGIDLAGPFPVITVQPPLNGQFGNPKLVVDRIPANEIPSPAKLRQRIQASLALYCKKLQESVNSPRAVLAKATKYASGHEQDPVPGGDRAPAGDDVSFPWGPDAPPQQPAFSPQWPVNGPAADVSSAASLVQLEAALPGAPLEFVLSQLRASATVQQAQAAWQFLQQQTKPSVTPQNPTTPSQPSGGLGMLTTTLIALFGGGGMSLVISIVFYLWGAYRQSAIAAGDKLLLSDEFFEKLKSVLQQNPQTVPKT